MYVHIVAYTEFTSTCKLRLKYGIGQRLYSLFPRPAPQLLSLAVVYVVLDVQRTEVTSSLISAHTPYNLGRKPTWVRD